MPFNLYQDQHGAGNTAAPTFDTNTTNASAVSLKTLTTVLNNAGAESRTLAAGVEGQVKNLRVDTFTAGGITVTLTGNPAATDVITFTAAAQSALLLYTAGVWQVVALNGATIA